MASFAPDNLGLSAAAVEKLKQVVGRRYNPNTNVCAPPPSEGEREREETRGAELVDQGGAPLRVVCFRPRFL